MTATINGYTVKYVQVDLNDKNIRVSIETAQKFPKGVESFSSILKRTQPIAAINGTYFCTETYVPVGDIVIDGLLYNSGTVGTAFAVDYNNNAFMLPYSESGYDYTSYRTALCSGPRLLIDGNIKIDGHAEGFSDPSVFSNALRSAIGITSNNKLLLITVTNKGCSLNTLANICKSLGAFQAITLDGGSSSGLYYNGTQYKKPGRMLTNILAIYYNQQTLSYSIEREYDNTANVEKTSDNHLFAEFDFFFPPKYSANEVIKIYGINDGDVIYGHTKINLKVLKLYEYQITSMCVNGNPVCMFNSGDIEYTIKSRQYENGPLKINVYVTHEDEVIEKEMMLIINND